MADIEDWACPTCNLPIVTAFCPRCGESRPSARDLTLHGLFAQFLHAFSTIDRRLLRSFGSLVTEPGVLTVSYVQGQRIPYVGPIQLFLIANLLFFAIQYLTGTNIVSSTLDSHFYHQDWGPFAQRLVADRLAVRQVTVESYAPIFNQAVVLYAKALIILMVLPFSLLVFALFTRNRQPFVAHAVFALYFYAFLLVLFCAALIIAKIQYLFGGGGLDSPWVDSVLTTVNLSLCCIHLYVATGTVYEARGTSRILKVLTLTVSVAAILLGYRFLLFLITLYTT